MKTRWLRSAAVVLTCLVSGSALGASPSAPSLVAATQQMTREGKWDEAEGELRRAIAGAKGEAKREAALRVELARVTADRSSYHRRDPEAVAAALQAAEAAARLAKDAQVDADLAQYSGQVLYGQAFSSGDWLTPRALFLSARDGRRRTGDRRGEAESLFYLGLTYEQPGEPEKAREHYEASLAISESIGDEGLQSYAHRHIGGLLEEEGRLDAAYEHIVCSVELRRRARYLALVPFALMQQADFLERHRRDHAGAMRLLEEAIDGAEAVGSTRAMSAARLSLAALYIDANEPSAALSFARCGVDAARSFGDPEVTADAEQQLSDVRKRLDS